MATTYGASRMAPRRRSRIGAIGAALKSALLLLAPSPRGTRLEADTWPDYLLRDVGLERSRIARDEPRDVLLR